MTQATIGIGSAANDGTGDTLRAALNKCNLNFTDLYRLTVEAGKSPAINGSVTIAGTDSTTITLPGVTATLAALAVAQTWTAVQAFTNSDIKLLGSSTGATTFTSANAGASNYTLTFPAITDTLAGLGTAQTWSAVQTFSAAPVVNNNTALNFKLQAGTATAALKVDTSDVLHIGAAGFSSISVDKALAFGTATAGLLAGAGAVAARAALGSTAGNALEFYLNATHTTGDMRANYTNMTFSGAGGSGEAGRFYSIVNNVTAAVGGTVNGSHVSLDFVGANAKISGAANALRATFGISDSAATAVGGTCSVIQADTWMDNAVTVPPNFAFFRCTNTGVKKSSNLLRVPNVLAETAGMFCAHTTQGMTHSLRYVSEDGTVYYLMATNANTNRTEA
jgi:hypothetical protein